MATAPDIDAVTDKVSASATPVASDRTVGVSSPVAADAISVSVDVAVDNVEVDAINVKPSMPLTPSTPVMSVEADDVRLRLPPTDSSITADDVVVDARLRAAAVPD